MNTDMVNSSSMWSTSLLYPYGTSEGDANGPFVGCQNGYTNALTVQPGFPFLGYVHMSLYVSSYSNIFPN